MKILKRISLIIISAFTILSLFSCGVYNTKNSSSKQKEVVHETTTAAAYATNNGFVKGNAKMSMAADVASEESFSEGGSGDRKIAKSVNIHTETKTFDSSIEWLKKYVASFNGIIDNSYIDTGDMGATNYKKNAYFAVRIPAEKLDSFLGKIGENLNVTFKQENIMDVTDDYFDSESRLKTLKIEEENLNELLKKAKSVDEMIKVEDKLSEVRSNIENINRRIKNYDKQINYSRVDINITEVKDLTDVKEDKDDLSKETLNKKLLKTVEEVKLFLRKVAAYIFVNIPWIILFLVVILIEVLIYTFVKAVFFKKSDNKDFEEDEKDTEKEKKGKNKKSKGKDKDKKEELSEEETLDKVFEEVNKVVMGESEGEANKESEVEVEFYNKEE